MSRAMLRYTSVAVVCLATAAVGFAQRQPSGSGSSSASGTSGSASGSAGSNGSATEHKSGASSASSDRATTAAGHSGQGHQAKATFEVYQDKSGEYRWRLRATNSQILAMAAQGYSDKRACMNAIESVRRDVADAPVEEKEAVAGSGEDHASKSGTASKTGSASKNGSGSGSGTGTGSAAGSGSGDATTAGSSGRKTQPK